MLAKPFNNIILGWYNKYGLSCGVGSFKFLRNGRFTFGVVNPHVILELESWAYGSNNFTIVLFFYFFDEDLGEKGSTTMRLASAMPDFFLLRYAEDLGADASLLSVALGYLDHCTTLRSTAQAVQASLLQRTKPITTRLTQNVRIGMVHKYPLSTVVYIVIYALISLYS